MSDLAVIALIALALAALWVWRMGFIQDAIWYHKEERKAFDRYVEAYKRANMAAMDARRHEDEGHE